MAMKTATTARKTNASRGNAEPSLALGSRTEVLRRCADVCQETITYCLERGGDHADAEHVRCLIDTAELCTVTANAIARESDHAADLKRTCAEVCECTAECCAEYEDDAQLKACEDVCQEAADFCNQK